MKIVDLLISDLRRQYFYAGFPEKKATTFGVVLAIGNVRYAPVLLYRVSHSLYCAKCTFLSKIVSLANFLLFGLEIATQCEIGPGLYFPHTVGTVIGAARIGSNAVIYHQVTLGAKEMDLGFQPDRRPVLGDNIIVGSGAKILGSISIGDNVTIGANAVVVESICCNVVVGGVPAKVIKCRLA